jgi:hypothetical protein
MELELERPKRASKAPVDKAAVDRAVLLAHGAGADMRADTLTAFSGALAAAGIPAMRFNFAYRAAGRGSPPRADTLLGEVRAARDELARRTKLPSDRIVLGGRSMGGRVASMVAGEDGALGLVLLGYPLHAPGRAHQPRAEHFRSLTMPVLFVSGTRDTFGTPDELATAARAIRGRVAWHWIDTADHGFRPLKKQTGLTTADALEIAAPIVVDWVRALGP